MKHTHKSILITSASALLLFVFVAATTGVVNYLGVSNQLTFNKETFTLTWSSHPTANYYKHEYSHTGDKPGVYKLMMLEAIEGNLKVIDAIKDKARQLTDRKKWDVICRYNTYSNEAKSDEGVIDFVVSDTTVHYEWNLYRYQQQKGADGKNYVVLLAYSYRDSLNTNDDAKKFFDMIKTTRTDRITELTAFDIPKVKVK